MINDKIIFVSYYTKDTPYEEVMDTYLKPSLQKYNLPYDIQGIDDLGSWQDNTSYKAKFMLDMLEKHKKDIVFLDSDATIEQYPSLFFEIPIENDIAVHYLDWYLMWRKKRGYNKRELLSGTMLFRYNPKVIKLTKKYIRACQINNIWEQKILQQIVKETKELKIYNLPPQYCAIIRQSGFIADYMKPSVILHHQVSRKFRKWKKINN